MFEQISQFQHLAIEKRNKKMANLVLVRLLTLALTTSQLAATYKAVCYHFFWLRNLLQDMMLRRKRGTEQSSGKYFEKCLAVWLTFSAIFAQETGARSPLLKSKCLLGKESHILVEESWRKHNILARNISVLQTHGKRESLGFKSTL